jgi:hypothetical protein
MTLPENMMHQGVSDLDFDTYFNVASNSIPQPVRHHQQSSFIYNQETFPEPLQRQIHQRNQLNVSFNTPLPTPNHNENAQETYFMAENPNSFQVPDWKFKEQQQQLQKQQHMYTPVTTPSEPYNSVTNLNQPSPRPDYFYEATHRPPSDSSAPPDHSQGLPSSLNNAQRIQHMRKDTSVQKSNNFEHPYASQQQSTYTSPNIHFPEPNYVQQTSTSELNGLQSPVSDIIFPGTSHNQTSIPQSNTNSQTSLSPKDSSSVDDSYKNAFETIDQWGKSSADKGKNSLYLYMYVISYFLVTIYSLFHCLCHNDKQYATFFSFFFFIKLTNKIDQHEIRHWRQSKRSGSSSSHSSSLIDATVATSNAQTTSHSPLETGRQLKKVAHNAIERRYRNNINDRIRDLKSVVPALYKARVREKHDEKGEETGDDMESTDNQEPSEIIEGVAMAKKLNKATILHKATEYIYYLKYTNDLARRENQLLEQILAQMPGGTKVLARFHKKKQDFQKGEQQRQIQERKEAMELEKAERQRILRERAAQRAALAKLLPKPSRRPYRRRAKKQSTDIPDVKAKKPACWSSTNSSPNNNNTTPSDDDQETLESNNDAFVSVARDETL